MWTENSNCLAGMGIDFAQKHQRKNFEKKTKAWHQN